MPTIDISKKDFEKKTKKMSIQEIEELLIFTKSEVDGVEKDTIKVDQKDTNRPDLWSIEGLLREIKGHLGMEKGIPKYKIHDSNYKVIVDKSVKKIRPFTVCAVVKGLEFNEKSLEQLIQLQEKIHMTYGRKRKMAAMGVYDFDKIEWPIHYKKAENIRFVPLGMDKEMTPKEIEKYHPKGKEYSHINNGEYTVFVDSKENVLSMPPIINSAYTGEVTTKTKNVFIEVSGFDLEYLMIPLNVLSTALAERGGKLYSVEIDYQKNKIKTPKLEEKSIEVDAKKIIDFIGLDIKEKDVEKLLNKMRYDVEKKKDKLIVKYLNYRNDILNWRDIAEDVAIAYGYNKIKPEVPEISTIGGNSELFEFTEKLKEIMIGFGFQETMTFNLTNKENLFRKMNINEKRICEIENPISINWSCLRNWLLPSSLEFLKKNKHVQFPQKVFEIGQILEIDEKSDTGCVNKEKISACWTDSRVNYSEMLSILDKLFSLIGKKYKIKQSSNQTFIENRRAEIIVDNKKIGFIGEVHPKVLNNWKIEKPVVAFELDVEKLL